MTLKPERIDNLRPEQYRSIMKRSSEDIASIYEEVRGIVLDIRDNGDQVSLNHYKKYKPNLTPKDLEVKK